MSFSFYVRNVPNASLAETLAALKIPDVMADCDVPKRGWPPIAHIYQDGVSVRAVETCLEDGALQVRIMVASSPDDFALAAAITEAVASRHNATIEPEDNGPLSISQWREQYGPAWQREHCDAYMRMVVGTYQREKGTMQMYGTHANFHAGPRVMEPLLKDPSTFPERFWAAFRRRNYLDREDVYGPSVMAVVPKGGSKQARFVVLGPGVITALSTEAQFVVLTSGMGDSRQWNLNVPLDDFVAIAGDSLTWIADDLAVTPGYEGDAWQRLVIAAKQRAVKDFVDRPDLLRDPLPAESRESRESPEPSDDEPDSLGLKDEHWAVLTCAPVVVFLMVAAADGDVDQKEIAAFGETLMSSIGGESRAMVGAAARVVPNLEALMGKLTEMDMEQWAKLLFTARQIVERAAGRAEADAFAKACYDLGVSVAEAAGGGFMGFGRKVGKEEKVILDALRKLLQVRG